MAGVEDPSREALRIGVTLLLVMRDELLCRPKATELRWGGVTMPVDDLDLLHLRRCKMNQENEGGVPVTVVFYTQQLGSASRRTHIGDFFILPCVRVIRIVFGYIGHAVQEPDLVVPHLSIGA